MSRNYQLLLGSLVLISFLQSWLPKEPPTIAYEFRNNEDGSYIDHITVGLDAANWLETHHQGAHIYGGFPQNYQLTQPYQGYVKTPFKFSSCDEFSPSNEVQLIYFYPYSFTDIPCETIIRQYPSTPIYKSMSGRIWATIHEIKRPSQLDLKQK